MSILIMQSCVNNSDQENENILHDGSRIQKELIGTWKFWGRFSIERNNWIPADPDQKFIYIFNSNRTFSYFDEASGTILSGDFDIIHATGKTNPYLLLRSKSNGEILSKKILIISLDNEFISIFEHTNEDRYQRQ
ncbi:hypothetical protein [Chryseobacterium lathyri]|uniref:hypothetical protein n=1 Tax=Chryseobacterium lathyri TaxID=395933 RepID=UPI001CC117AE|nr:hypothetical protein [Chryseobacterium lathyri]